MLKLQVALIRLKFLFPPITNQCRPLPFFSTVDTSKNVCQNTNSLRLLCDREYSKLRKSLLDQQRFSSARWSEGFRWAAVKWLGLGAVACGRQSKQRKAGSRMSSYCVSVWGEGEPSFNGLSYTLRYLSTLLALTWFVLLLQRKPIWNHMMRRMHLGMSVIFSFNSQFCQSAHSIPLWMMM